MRPAHPGVFVDPGQSIRDEAEEILDGAREDLETAGRRRRRQAPERRRRQDRRAVRLLGRRRGLRGPRASKWPWSKETEDDLEFGDKPGESPWELSLGSGSLSAWIFNSDASWEDHYGPLGLNAEYSALVGVQGDYSAKIDDTGGHAGGELFGGAKLTGKGGVDLGPLGGNVDVEGWAGAGIAGGRWTSAATRARSPSAATVASAGASVARSVATSPSTCPSCSTPAATSSNPSEDSSRERDPAHPGPVRAARSRLGARRPGGLRHRERRVRRRPHADQPGLHTDPGDQRRRAVRRRHAARHRRGGRGAADPGDPAPQAAAPRGGRLREGAGDHPAHRRRHRGRRPAPRPRAAPGAHRASSTWTTRASGWW